MNILILDDNLARHDAFRQRYPNDHIVSCLTYGAFIDVLSDVRFTGQVFDLIHLDHDLGDFQDADTYIDGWGKQQAYNGTHAAKSILGHLSVYPQPSLQVIIHSVNPVGAQNMLAILGSEQVRDVFGVSVSWVPFQDNVYDTVQLG